MTQDSAYLESFVRPYSLGPNNSQKISNFEGPAEQKQSATQYQTSTAHREVHVPEINVASKQTSTCMLTEVFEYAPVKAGA